METDNDLVALASLHGKLQLITYGLIDYLVRHGIADINELVSHIDNYAKRRGYDVAVAISEALDDASSQPAGDSGPPH